MPDYSYETLLVKQNCSVLITLNRPERLNAVNEVMHQELETVFGEVTVDASVSAVVVTGSGRESCSCGDVRGMDELGGAIAIQSRPLGLMSPGDRRMFAQHALGGAAGLGATIALFCDIIYASNQARIGDTHVKAGLVAGDGERSSGPCWWESPRQRNFC